MIAFQTTDEDYGDDDSLFFRARRNFHPDGRREPSTFFLSPSSLLPERGTNRECEGRKTLFSYRPLRLLILATLPDGSSQGSRKSKTSLLSLPSQSDDSHLRRGKTSTSFLARVRKGAFSFINRQARRLERWATLLIRLNCVCSICFVWNLRIKALSQVLCRHCNCWGLTW